MPGLIKLAFLWAALGSIALVSAGCDMVRVDSVHLMTGNDRVFGGTGFEVKKRNDKLEDGSKKALCPKDSDGKVIFGVVVDYFSAKDWKSHIVMSRINKNKKDEKDKKDKKNKKDKRNKIDRRKLKDDDEEEESDEFDGVFPEDDEDEDECEVLDILEFPKDESCTQWVIKGGNYLDQWLTVIIKELEIKQEKENTGVKVPEPTFKLDYGAKEFSSDDSTCGCSQMSMKDTHSKEMVQWRCSCPITSR